MPVAIPNLQVVVLTVLTMTNVHVTHIERDDFAVRGRDAPRAVVAVFARAQGTDAPQLLMIPLGRGERVIRRQKRSSTSWKVMQNL